MRKPNLQKMQFYQLQIQMLGPKKIKLLLLLQSLKHYRFYNT